MASAPQRTSSRATNGQGDERLRMSGAGGGSFKTERPADARKAASPQQPASGFAGTAHKRTASGNPRPLSKATEERRFEERRITERTYEAHVERVVPRPTSQERAQKRSDKRPAEAVPRHKSADGRPKEPRAETPQGRWPGPWDKTLKS